MRWKDSFKFLGICLFFLAVFITFMLVGVIFFTHFGNTCSSFLICLEIVGMIFLLVTFFLIQTDNVICFELAIFLGIAVVSLFFLLLAMLLRGDLIL